MLFCQIISLTYDTLPLEIVELFFRGFDESFFEGKTGLGRVLTPPFPWFSFCNRVSDCPLLNTIFHIEINKTSGKSFSLLVEAIWDF